jgi:antitoxin component of RelBE/YafQ-DinJ toxin-antitoxin module
MVDKETKQVNFRANVINYQAAQEELGEVGISVSDFLNAALYKVKTGAINPTKFVSEESFDDELLSSLEELKKELRIGHQAIQEGRVISLEDARKEFGL